MPATLPSTRSQTRSQSWLEIFWDARSVNQQSSSNDRDGFRIGIGFVPGERRLGLIMNLSVRDNILLTSLDLLARGGHIDRASGDRLVGQLIELLDIRPRQADLPGADRPAAGRRQFSRGRQPRRLCGL